MNGMSRLASAIVAAALTVPVAAGSVSAQQREPIKFALIQDFTAVYTFATEEVNQGQRDYITLINDSGGIEGHPVELIIRDTGNEPQRGIEAYNRARAEGAVMVDFLSTPVSRANVSRVIQDQVVMTTALHGRGDASDGQTFPFVFPLMATYWSQAAALAQYVEQHEGGLRGKRIAFVHIDSPFGREPINTLTELSRRYGFELRTFAYPSPGNEQSATWTDVRRYRPDFVFLWGAGGGNPVSIREAIRNGIPTQRILAVVWVAETDVRTAGAAQSRGIRRFEAVVTGTDTPILRRIVENVINTGKGAGDRTKVGTTYYNIGVAYMAAVVEGARIALREFGAPLTGDKLRQGLERLRDFDAEGLMPPITITPQDHQGGGFGRISEWDGQRWVPLTDWFNAHQDLVWEEIRREAAAFRSESGR